MTNFNTTPFFSVVIPLYNKEKYILSTIASVTNQSFKDFEIIIVDDGSTDRSKSIISKIKDSRIKIITQQNLGAPNARNNGIAKAKAKYIALLDADDTWYHNHLLELKKQIEIYPNAGLYCNNYDIYYSETVKKNAQFNFNFDDKCLVVDDYFKASIINSVAWTSAVAFEKEKFISIGGFDTTLKTAQDIDLWIRFALLYKVIFNPTITMSYKFHVDDSLSKNEESYNQIRLDSFKKYKKEEANNPSLKLYLDINRYALAIRCKLNHQLELFETVKKDIDYANLNLKQKILISLPKQLLILAKNTQNFLKKRKLYVTAYK
ncbi:glycosyltransferase involved in cell wall biosynthesis [Jejuia pallidilutea]|uniref:Glycosyltransferase involved in cell wall biosynthesis n=1 Tax=Jejuia pallidilutea TaxID=504487 RepID=A0A362X2U9_9FLAO|nr:glycosyltransferase [Jejuia pallidilutea]PQV48203.1 glycosyltransferase involved in cell wall biosynthesis [Jejuia pallidilutea]